MCAALITFYILYKHIYTNMYIHINICMNIHMFTSVNK